MNESVSVESRQAFGLVDLLRSTRPFDGLPEALLGALAARMSRVRLHDGQVLLNKDDRVDSMYLVVSGALQSSDGARIGPGQLVGEIQILIGGRAPQTLSASGATDLARVQKSELELLAKEAPQLLLALGDLIRTRLRQEQAGRVLRNVFGDLDALALERIEDELEWVELRPGDALFEQGDPSDCMYLVVSGRLVGVRKREGDAGESGQVTVEIGRGESIGEMGFFTGEPRSLGIYARRTSQLVRFHKPVFDHLSHEHPRAMLYITELLIRRLQRASGFVRASYERSNIVVLPLSPGVQATAFTERLVKALRVHGETLYVNSSRLDHFIGVPGFAQTPGDSPLDLALDAGLDDRESGFPYAVYECDPADSAWTRRCVERADRILLLADPGAEPALTPVERDVLGAPQDFTTAKRTLVLLHPETTELPTGTRHWLGPRKLDGHLHMRWDRDADVARLARILTGNSIGAVLGGGGARGFAHLGAIRAFREAGIPIDLIGGTSMGALIAVQPALGWDDETMFRMNHGSFVKNKPISFRDYTLPVYSLVGGRRLDQSLMGPLGDVRIEDLWTGYFCVSSNLTRAQPMVHRMGPVWKAIRASISIPGIFRPVIEGNDLLVDGGVLNNVPGDVMRQIGGGWVIAVDVSTDRELEVSGVLPPAWKVLLNWLNPFARPVELPSIFNLMQRTTLLASVEKTDAVKKLVDLYIQPRLERFGLMQFGAFEEVVEEGYRHAKQSVDAWVRERPELAKMLQAAES